MRFDADFIKVMKKYGQMPPTTVEDLVANLTDWKAVYDQVLAEQKAKHDQVLAEEKATLIAKQNELIKEKNALSAKKQVLTVEKTYLAGKCNEMFADKTAIIETLDDKSKSDKQKVAALLELLQTREANTNSKTQRSKSCQIV